MSIFKVASLEKPIDAIVEIPSSKSYTNRALVMAALTPHPVTLFDPLYSEDTKAMIDCLRTLGLRIEIFPKKILVHDDISVIQDKVYDLHAKDSGTTFRFLLALLCLTPGTKTLRGNPRLNERPIKELVEALLQLGAKIDYLEKEGQPPLKITYSPLNQGSEVILNASLSSQFFSALLMIAPFLNGLTIRLLTPLISKPYVEMTIDMMQKWAVNVLKLKEGSYFIPSNQSYQKNHYVIEKDFSSAGYFFAIAALTQSTLTLKGLNPNSIQADQKFLSILKKMGNQVKLRKQGITMIGKQLLPQSIEMEECPDQVQTMAVLAAFAKGVTRISGVRSLRFKETERVEALKIELAKMKIQTKDTPNTLTIYGGAPQAATIDTYGDHRMAMAFAVAGTKLPGMKICHPEVVNKTFPTFWEQLNSL